MEQGDVEQKSKYNTTLGQIYRLNQLREDVNKYSRDGNYTKWNETLDRIWCELARDLNPNDYAKKKEEFDKFETQLSNYGQLDTRKPGFSKSTDIEKRNRYYQYKILIDKDIFLARVENEVGKGTEFEDPDEEEM